MSSLFLNIALRRPLPALRHAPVFRLAQSRAFSIQKAPFRSPVLNALSQRAIKIPTPQRSFFTSSKQSIRYPAPPPGRRGGTPFLSFLDRIPSNTVLYGIIGLNVAVFGAWLLVQQKHKIEHDVKPVIWMYQNFTSSWQNLWAGRIWTPLTSCFSHKDWGHILFNGFTFFFMAPTVLQILGSRRFIFLYIGGGLISSASSLLYGRFVDRKDVPSHGASGAIYSVVSFLACVAPTLTFQLYGIVPVPAWLVVTGLFGYDAYNTYTNNRGGTDTVGHIGGMLAGAAAFVFLRRTGSIRYY